MQDFSFSKELIADTIACFKEEDGLLLPPEEAVEILRSFAGLYLAFAEESRVVSARLKAAGTSCSTGSSNTCGVLSNKT